MKNRRTIVSYASLILTLILVVAALAAPHAVDVARRSGSAASTPIVRANWTPPADTTDRLAGRAEDVFENVKVLKGMSGAELIDAMDFIATSLDVHCSFCHVRGNFSSDDKPQKRTARSMILMVRGIDSANFGGRNTVTCYTCHRGSPHVHGAPALAASDWRSLDVHDEDDLPKDSSATLASVLDRYRKALGGTKNIDRIRSERVESKFRMGESEGTSSTVRQWPDLVRSTMTTPGPRGGTMVELYNGVNGWQSVPGRGVSREHGMELVMLKRDAEIVPALEMLSDAESKLIGTDTMNGVTYDIVAANLGDVSERLFFDRTTGLLDRRYVQVDTPLGPLPFSIAYADYRDVNGVKLPHTIEWETGERDWTVTVTEVTANPKVEPGTFATPE